VNTELYNQFLFELIDNASDLDLVDGSCSFHKSKSVRKFVRAHRAEVTHLFLAEALPEFNPAEQVGNEIKNNKIGKQPVKNKKDLGERIFAELKSLQHCTERVKSFLNCPLRITY